MERARTANNLAVWVVTVLLAAIFLLAGVPKLLGTSTLGLQAAAMAGYPNWIRAAVGVVEVAGAIAILVPTTATLAAVSLTLLMVPATIAQWASGEGHVYVPIVIGVLLLFVVAQRSTDAIRGVYHTTFQQPNPILREGVVSGVIGATCIAVWFFFVDLIAGHPLFTPATLGRSLFRVLGAIPVSEGAMVHIVVYTLFHYAAFIVVGIIAAFVVHWAADEPSVLLGFVILFVAVEVGFYALVAVLQQASPLGALAWYQVMVGNIIAAAAMGVYLSRAHPLLRERFVHALDGSP